MAKWDASVRYSGGLWTKPQMTAEIRTAIKLTRVFMLDRLKKNSPVKTGKLRKSWRVSVGDRLFVVRNDVRNKKGTPYAGFVDLGTRKIKPRRFTEKSVNEAAEHFKDTLADLVDKKLNRRNTKTNRQLAASVAKLRGARNIKEKPILKL